MKLLILIAYIINRMFQCVILNMLKEILSHYNALTYIVNITSQLPKVLLYTTQFLTISFLL